MMANIAVKEPCRIAGGAELNVMRFGQGEPCVTLIHGGLVGTYSWRFQLPSRTKPNLRRSARQLIAYDQRGYGSSSGSQGPHDIDTLATDLIAVLDRLGIERSVLVGFSLGGFVALEAASRHPDRVIALVLEGCAEPSDAVRAQFEERGETLERAGAEAVAEHAAFAFSDRFRAEQPEVMAEYSEVARKLPPAYLAESLRSIAAWQLTDSHRQIGAPLLTVCGEHDRNFGPSRCERLAAVMPNAESVTILGAGHTSHIENAGAFNHLVTDFIDRIHA